MVLSMKRLLLIVAFLGAFGASVQGIGLTEIIYPIFLPYTQADEEVSLRQLPFATRHAFPEGIGSALSAPYVVPHIDSANLPKDINVISVCGIAVDVREVKVKGKVGVTVSIDLAKFSKPKYYPFSEKDILKKVAAAVQSTLYFHRRHIHHMEVKAGKHEELGALLEKALEAWKPGEKALRRKA